MTDIGIYLQYETKNKYCQNMFATFSELKETAIKCFYIPKLERDNLNFIFEYERTQIYIQDDEDVKYIFQILEILHKFEVKYCI